MRMKKDVMAFIMAYSRFNEVKEMYDYDKLMRLSRGELESKYKEFLALETAAILRGELGE